MTTLTAAADTAADTLPANPTHVPPAVMFDLDGTLVDTERTWLEAVRRTVQGLGGAIDDAALLSYEGATLEQASSRIIAAYDVSLPEMQVVRMLEDTTLEALQKEVAWREGAGELLRALSAAGTSLALVTSSTKRWVDAVAGHVDLTTFDHIVTADDVHHTKPHPEPYLRAAKLLGVDPSLCVVFEDSRVGTEAALAAGCVSVLLQPTTALWSERVHATAPTFTGIDPAWIAGVMNRAHPAAS